MIRRPHILLFAAAASLFLGAYTASLRLWVPAFDELDYLAYARTLALTGSYAATPAGPAADSGPGREPGYSVVLAGVMRLDPGLREAVTRCSPPDAACASVYRDARFLNAALIGLAAISALLAAAALGAGPAASLLAGAYIVLNFQMIKTATHVISDYLALAFVAVLSFVLIRFAREPKRWALALGLVLSALALTKTIYLAFALAVLAGTLIAGLGRVRRDGAAALLAAAVVGAVLVIAVGGWTARNLEYYGRAFDNRGAAGLSMREVFDHMTPAENLAAFVWWTRGFGENLARRILPESAWRRHELYVEDGFYLQGLITRYRDRVQLQMTQNHLSQADAEGAVPGMVIREIAADWPAYVATMPALFYRGLWFDEFIVFGFPALCWLVIRSIRRRDGTLLLALSPGLFSLLVYPMVSLNVPRYQFTAAPALAVAAGLAIDALWRRRRSSRL